MHPELFVFFFAHAVIATIVAMSAATIALIYFVERDKSHQPLLSERWWYTPLTVIGYLASLLVGVTITTLLTSEYGIRLPLWSVFLPLLIYCYWRNARHAMAQIHELEAFCRDAARKLYHKLGNKQREGAKHLRRVR